MEHHALAPEQFQALVGFLFPLFLQVAKVVQFSFFKWVQQNTPRINVTISAAVAIFGGLGIHFEFAVQAHHLLITWPDFSTFVHINTAIIMQLVIQHTSYEGFWRIFVPVAPPKA